MLKVSEMKYKIFIYVILFLTIAGAVAAPQSTEWAKVTFYGTGWSSDSVRVTLNAPFVSNGCTGFDGYVTDPNDTGNHAHQSALLMAFAASKDVQIVVDGCYNTRPKIIGVYVR